MDEFPIDGVFAHHRAGFSWELGLQKSKRPTGALGKIHSWKGMEAPYGESCWIT